jgi:hypothetical protein
MNHFADMKESEATVVITYDYDDLRGDYNAEVHVFSSYFNAAEFIASQENKSNKSSDVYIVNHESFISVKIKLPDMNCYCSYTDCMVCNYLEGVRESTPLRIFEEEGALCNTFAKHMFDLHSANTFVMIH